MDTLTPAQRRKTMTAVKSRDTSPELLVRRLLHAAGFRFRLHRKDLPGKPDVLLPRYRTVVFVHGCFWHQHPDCKGSLRPKSNTEYWDKKLTRNVERDAQTKVQLESLGWHVITVWECETREPDVLIARLKAELRK